MNLLSVPVGVTLSRDINLSSWKLKPMVDLTVTGNFGDTDMDSSVKWGNSNPFGVNSEVVDDFTYGVKAGLATLAPRIPTSSTLVLKFVTTSNEPRATKA